MSIDFFFNDTATTEIYTLSLHDALPISLRTLTLLADGGFTEDEAAAWLYTEHDELGETPMEAMLAGRHHRVNAIASTLAL